jgi:hypothetical protein
MNHSTSGLVLTAVATIASDQEGHVVQRRVVSLAVILLIIRGQEADDILAIRSKLTVPDTR